MKLQHNKLWLAISLGIVSGSAVAATPTCTVTPANSIITEGQALQLQAKCDADLTSINWKMDDNSVTGDVSGSYPANIPIFYTTPIGLGGSNTFVFTVDGSDGATTPASAGATVFVKPGSAVVAQAAGIENPTARANASCAKPAHADGTAVYTTMPANGDQCNTANSKPALAISGPTAFTWSCISLTGGDEANCSAKRGYKVTPAVDGGNGTLSLTPADGVVESGGSATVKATPGLNYSVSSITGCGVTPAGSNTYTTGPVTAPCTITAKFANTPQAGTCGTANAVATLAAPTTNLCGVGTASGVTDATGQFTWTCAGTNGGATTSCAAPKQYTVTATLSGTGGTLNAPTSKTVTHNATTTFSVTPDAGNEPAVTTTGSCTASVSGSTITTGAVSGACSVTVTFAAASTCALPPNTTVYTPASPEPYVAVFDTIFDLATSSATLDSTIAKNATKSYEFTNDKAFRNGNIYNYYSTGPKDISISACPGDFNVATECKAIGATAPRLYWSRDGLKYVHPIYSYLQYSTCNIGTGGKVYLNVRNSGTTSVSYQIRNEVLNVQ